MTTPRPAPRIYDVTGGQLVPDVSGFDWPTAIARKRELEALLAATRGDPAKAKERDRLRAEDEAISKRLRGAPGADEGRERPTQLRRHR